MQTVAATPDFTMQVLLHPQVPRAQLDQQAAAIYGIHAGREREFGFGPDVTIDYPPIIDPPSSDFLADPVGYIAGRLAAVEQDRPVGQVVVLTTYGQAVRAPLAAAGYTPHRIDMPAGPDHTFAFTLDRAGQAAPAGTLYLEAVDEGDEKIRPTWLLALQDGAGRLCGGACGSIHHRDGQAFAYVAMMTLEPGLPPGTGKRLAQAMLEVLRQQGVVVVHLGTQTAERFYRQLGFTVTHRLVSGLRTRTSATGQQLAQDLVMMRLDLAAHSHSIVPGGFDV